MSFVPALGRWFSASSPHSYPGPRRAVARETGTRWGVPTHCLSRACLTTSDDGLASRASPASSRTSSGMERRPSQSARFLSHRARRWSFSSSSPRSSLALSLPRPFRPSPQARISVPLRYRRSLPSPTQHAFRSHHHRRRRLPRSAPSLLEGERGLTERVAGSAVADRPHGRNVALHARRATKGPAYPYACLGRLPSDG